MILGPLLNPKFVFGRAAKGCELRVRGTRTGTGWAGAPCHKMGQNMRLVIAVLVSLVVASTVRHASAQKSDSPSSARVALIIGNANYQDSDTALKELINDARVLAQELRKVGFDVNLGENLSKDAMRRAFDRLYDKLKPGAAALVFFSGYGIQSNRQNYMIPTDAHIWTEPEVRRDGISLDSVLAEISARGASTGIGILDASRRNPFERRYRLTSAGLASTNAPRGTIVMYSAAPGSVAEEASRGTFVSELIKQIQAPDLLLDEIFNRTRIAVSETSQGERVPWFSSSLTDDFSFGPTVTKAAEKATATAAQPASRVDDDRKPVVPVTPERKAEQSAEPKTAAANPSTPPPARPQPADAAKPAAVGIGSPPDRAAIETLDARLKDNPKDATAFYKRGQLYTKNGLFARAAADFDAAIQLNPNDPDVLNNRCWARAMYADLQLALQDCNEALRLRPGFAEALDSRGLVNLKLSLMKNAIADYDAALQIRPNLASSLYGRGISKQRSGKTAEGDADIAAAKALDANIADEFVRYGIR